MSDEVKISSPVDHLLWARDRIAESIKRDDRDIARFTDDLSRYSRLMKEACDHKLALIKEIALIDAAIEKLNA